MTNITVHVSFKRAEGAQSSQGVSLICKDKEQAEAIIKALDDKYPDRAYVEARDGHAFIATKDVIYAYID